VPNSLGPNGLTIATQQELVTNFTAFMMSIFGFNIDLTSSSPDGQRMMLGTVQPSLDIEALLMQIYSSFDVTQAIGVQLDQRVALNGLQRQGGTFTITPVSITASQALTLYGLDQTAQPIYTVADAAGNQWQLITTQVISGPGTNSYSFQAANPGAVLTTPNTITVPVSIVLGVTSINNPSTYSTLGVNEESDAALKIRQIQSTQLPSQGFIPGLKAALLNIPGMTYVNIDNNYTGSTDAYGTPAHYIWVIVAGSAAASAIANAIYVNLGEGVGMRGAQSYNITQPDGTSFTVFWDNVASENLYIKFTATSINGTTPPNIAGILAQLPVLYVPGVGQEVNTNQLITYVNQIDPNCLVTNAGFSISSGGTYMTKFSPTAINYQFSVLSANIQITPIVMLPTAVSVAPSGTQQFTAYGGTQTGYTYSISVNNSGGSINASTGLYTAGTTPGIDTILVTDSGSNTATSTATVT
jgi:hypothetical protein